MNVHSFKILFLSLFLSPALAFSQKISDLPKAAGITVGKLPDGISYYLTTNKTELGRADYCLIQSAGADTEAQKNALRSLPHFPGLNTYQFLANNGAGYRPEGYLSSNGTHNFFRFENIRQDNQAVTDSTLLMIFELALTSDKEQTIVICGDINAAKVAERMQSLYMMVPQLAPAPKAPVYKWKRDSVARATSGFSKTAGFQISYRAPRMAQKQMKTMIPVLNGIFIHTLGRILNARLNEAFLSAGIPLGSFRCSFADSGTTKGDELISFSVTTSENCLEKAVGITGSVLADMDAGGISCEEYLCNRTPVIKELFRDRNNLRFTNRQWTDRCIAAVIYGYHIANAADAYNLFAKVGPQDIKEDLLFNRYLAALLDGNDNLSIAVKGPGVSGGEEDRYLQSFRSGWGNPLHRISKVVDLADTARLISPKKKVKLKTTIADSSTGGEMWTFSNGMKVLYKKTSEKNAFRYAMIVKGGYLSLDDISVADCAFVDDILDLNSVCGMGGEYFKNLLLQQGVRFDAGASMSSLNLSGKAPSDKLPLVIRALLSYAYGRSSDAGSLKAYQLSEPVRFNAWRQSASGEIFRADSLLNPRAAVVQSKDFNSLDNGLMKRCNSWLDKQFACCNNGLLILMGDFDADALKKQLSKLMGGFHTGNQRPVKPKMTFNIPSAWHSTYCNGYPEGSYIRVMASRHFSTADFISLRLAALALERRLCQAFAPLGVNVKVNYDFYIFPTEQIFLDILCKPCPQSGVASGIIPADSYMIRDVIRSELLKLSKTPVSAAELKLCKTALTNMMAAELTDDDILIESVVLRQSLGKDLFNSYKSNISSAKEKDILEIFASLDNGGKSEVIFQ